MQNTKKSTLHVVQKVSNILLYKLKKKKTKKKKNRQIAVVIIWYSNVGRHK